MKVEGAVAYDATYIDEVMLNFGYMCYCSEVLFSVPLEKFFDKFIQSPLCREIEEGNPHYLVGYSGKEMAELVLHRRTDIKFYFDMGNIFMWIGRSIALVQWYTRYPFKTILEMQPVDEWFYMFVEYHEVGESHLLKWADEVFIR